MSNVERIRGIEMPPLHSSASWQPYLNSAQVLSGYATAIGAAIAAVSLLLILLQVVWSARLSKQSTALDAHKEYMKLCIERPELSSSGMALKYVGVKSFEGILDTYKVKSERVLWFLSYVLYAMEQILQSSKFFIWTDRAWRETAKDQLRYHTLTLRAVWPSWRFHYGPELRELVDQILAENTIGDGTG